MFKWLKNKLRDKNPEETKGGENMARQPKDLVKAAKDKAPEKSKAVEDPAEPEQQVQIISEQQLIINHLSHIIANQVRIENMMMEGFKQVGVNFEEKK